jgi:DNA-binding response OmpR family regulator
LVEDDAIIGAAIRDSLQRDGHYADWVTDARHADAAFGKTRYDLVILDLSLPDIDGIELLNHWRAARHGTPVIAVTARASLEDKIQGLDSGADDYLVKPFEMAELLARVRAILRRPGGVLGHLLTLGNLELDTVRRALKVARRRINIPRRELAVLELLMRNAERVVEHEAAMRAAYSADEHVSSNVMEANLSRLRQRLEAAGADIRIHTIRGLGYMIQGAG